VRRLLQRLRRRKRTSTLDVPAPVAEEASNHLLEMDEKLEEIAELRGLEEFPRTRRIPPRALPLWHRALSAYDRYVETMARGTGLDLRCSLGCVACCHDVPTGVQAIEHVNIYVTSRELGDFERIHNRACDLADELYELLREEAPDGRQALSDSKAYQNAQLGYRKKQLPCAFLDTTKKRCRIYEARPIWCRMHVSVTDPDWCWVDHPRANEAVTPNLAPPESIVAIMKDIATRMGLGHLSPSLFQGLATLGGEIMSGGRIEARAELRRRGRGGEPR
jgi:Fe-S-cluster containining protein